jgi:hypothetical protein
MVIGRQPDLRSKMFRKYLIVVALCIIAFSTAGKQIKIFEPYFVVSIHVLYSAYLYLSYPSYYIMVNLSSIHQNIMFTSDTAYFLNGVAYDYYSINEINDDSGPGSQWEIFPLPNEHLPPDITPWTPHQHLQDDIRSADIPVSSETTTGLAFVDHIYIVTSPTLTDRHDNLEKMLVGYQITNYEWRKKWTYATCIALNNREEINRKMNLDKRFSIGKIRFFSIVS